MVLTIGDVTDSDGAIAVTCGFVEHGVGGDHQE